MTGLHDNPTTHRAPHHKTGLFWLTISLATLALAGDTPPPTLPKGFLEDLPVMETFEEQEFAAFLAFVKEQVLPKPASPEAPANPAEEQGSDG